MATNINQQQVMLPMQVQQAAMAQQLGAFTKVYGASLTRTVIAIVLFGLGALFFLGGGTLATDIDSETRVILLLFGVFFLCLAVYLIFIAVQAAGQQVYLFYQGIVINKGDRVQVMPWSQMAEVLQSVTRRYTNGVYVGTTYVYTLRRADGYQVRLGNMTKGIAELGPAIALGITRELVPRALAALRAGQTLAFGPFSVSQQGIGNGREFIPWQQVQSVNVNRGRITIKKVGVSRAWGTIMVAKLANFFVFTVAVEEMRRRA